MNITTRLLELRKEYNYTQSQLADILGVSRTAIAAYESGQSSIPLNRLNELARLYNVSTDYLLCNTNSRGRDISYNNINDVKDKLENTIYDIMTCENFGGCPLDDNSKLVIVNSLRNSIEIGKIIVESKEKK